MIIVSPSVHLLSVMDFDRESPEKLIEFAGRMAHKSHDRVTDDSHQAFIEKVVGQLHHESIAEHSCASFHIVCDRGVSHELVRHRLASFTQESTRYCNYSQDKFHGQLTFIMPPGLDDQTRSLWRMLCQDAESAYLGMLTHGASPQIARSVLPNSLKTELVMTANFREWKHFLELRCAPAAHPQMREIAELIRERLVLAAPTVFQAFNKEN